MTSAPTFDSYGDLIYQPEGVPFFQFQSSLLGKTTWSKGFQDFIKALWTEFNGHMKTHVKRRKIRDRMVEQTDDPERKERYRSLSLRAITAWFAKARDELEMIKRHRLETSNDWETEFAKPFLGRLEKPAAVAAAHKNTAVPLSSKAPLPGEIEDAKAQLEIMPRLGYQAVLNPSSPYGVTWRKIEGVIHKKLDDGLLRFLKRLAPAIKFLLESNRPALE
jgi:hypothetical protein